MRAQGRDRFREGGFTLMELIIVMTLLAILMAGVTPIFRESITELRQKRVVTDLLSVMKYAQERAIADGVEYRFCMDRQKEKYWVERFSKLVGTEKEFIMAPDGLLKPVTLPDAVRFAQISAVSERGPYVKHIAFYPNGACDYASVALLIGRERVEIETRGRIGQLKVRS